MKKVLFVSLLLAITSCSKKGTGTPAKLRLMSSAFTQALSTSGGALITGKSSSGESFQIGLQTGNEETSVELTPGSWEFAAITWENENSEGPMTGTNRCALTSATIEGEEVIVDLNLNPATCSSPHFSSTENINGNQFNRLKLVACKNLYGIADRYTSCSTNSFLQGNNLSYRILFQGQDLSKGIPLPSLASACIKSADLTNSDYNTNYRLPLNTNGNFPFVIIAYEDLNCDPNEQEAKYLFQGQSIPGQKSADSLTFGDPSSGETAFFFADNYIGTGGNTFANSGMLLPFQVLANRYDDPLNSGGGGDAYQNTREEFVSILGTQNLTSPWSLGNLGRIISPLGDANGAFLDITTVNNTDLYNGMTFSFIDGGATTCPVSTTFTSSPPSIDITYCTNTTAIPTVTTTDDIVNAINSELTANELASEIVATNTRVGTDLVPSLSQSSVTIEYGRAGEAVSSRNDGLYGEIAGAFYGHLGAMLFEAGFETCSEIPTSGGFTYTVKAGDTVELKFSSGKIPMTEWMALNGTYPQRNIFEKRVAFHEKGVMREFYEFNCSGNFNAGFYRANHNDDSEDYRIEAYYDAQSASDLIFESTKYSNRTESGQASTSKQWSFLKNEQTSPAEVKLWMVKYYSDTANSIVNGDIYAAKLSGAYIYTSSKHFDQAAFATEDIDFVMGTGTDDAKYDLVGSTAGVTGFQDPLPHQPSTLAMNSVQFPKLMSAIPTHMAPMSMNDSRLLPGFGPYVTYQSYKRTMDFFDDWNMRNSQLGCFVDEADSEDFILGPLTSLFTDSSNYLYSQNYSSLYNMSPLTITSQGCSSIIWDTNFNQVTINEFSFRNYDGTQNLPSTEYLDEGTTFDFTIPVEHNGSPDTFSNTLITTNEAPQSGQNKGNLRLFGDQFIPSVVFDVAPPVYVGSSTVFTMTVSGVVPGTTLNVTSTGASSPACALDLPFYNSITCTPPGNQVAGDDWLIMLDNPTIGSSMNYTITIQP